MAIASYRCHIFRDDGDWFAIADILGSTDDDAIRQARQLSDDRAFELRLRERLIHRQEATATDAASAAAATAMVELAG